MKRQPYQFDAAPTSAKPIWRSIEDKRNPERAAAEATAEFPTGVVDAANLLGRRSFMAVGGAGAALALSGCDALRRPEEEILPFSRGPEYVLPGIPLTFASVLPRNGESVGVLVTSNEGRPTKVEGNPAHPASLGSTDALLQAAMMDLYDPDRSRTPAKRGEDGSLEDTDFAAFDEALEGRLASHAGRQGAGLRVLRRPFRSATMARLEAAFLARFPQAKVHVWGPVTDRNAQAGAKLAFGRNVDVLPRFGEAQVVLSLDADFLGTDSRMVRATREFAETRKVMDASEAGRMSRLFVVEGGHSITGSNADHRLRLPSGEVERYLRALCRQLASAHGLDFGAAGAALGTPSTDGIPTRWLETVAKELVAAGDTALVVAGSGQPPRVHALVHLLNEALGNTGKTVRYEVPVDVRTVDPAEDVAALAEAMKAGQVDTLVILGGNPVYDAPADLGFADALGKVEASFHLAHNRDETSARCTWHAPRSHELESWGDAWSREGVYAIQQPLIAPIWSSRSELELLGMLAGESNFRGYPQVRRTFRSFAGDGVGFEKTWRTALHTGVVQPTPRSGRTVPTGTVLREAVAEALGSGSREPGTYSKDAMEVRFVPDHRLHDGSFANNLWMLELPEQMTKLSWDNAALISPKTAQALGVEDGDVVRLSRSGVEPLELPVAVLPGHANESITLTLGWGRSRAGRWGSGQGFDVYPFRTTDGLDFVSGVKVERAGRRYWLARTQEHHRMEGRPIAIDMTVDEYKEQPELPSYRTVEMSIPPLWEQVVYDGRKWGMTIDLTTCTGCNACVIACQAENNIPSVGKRELARGREMYWIRIDRYWVGEDEDEPEVAVQPVACVHCEEAPCENVCPVNATVHSPEGTNMMTYNRCIGTRYCMNNCPYKVRRFNYFNWHGTDPAETKKMQFNPNVTVRYRGVMEKCSYCAQRIEEAKYEAKRQRRDLRDGDIITACQQACPAHAIVFGDLNDKDSKVAKHYSVDRGYALLAEIGTQPRTRFLGQIRNVNPEMKA
ncbi:MAG TPA: 4Fe-4S dicluster domain-containing protein [Polyangiaceae bacterium LLY-WYZ-14_1]|nr:4Fe-4S dicluster domain-containing protein [Polyangiaceae bacterium LLY-WYZ-14_1]